jgi:hypothetical protein
MKQTWTKVSKQACSKTTNPQQWQQSSQWLVPYDNRSPETPYLWVGFLDTNILCCRGNPTQRSNGTSYTVVVRIKNVAMGEGSPTYGDHHTH